MITLSPYKNLVLIVLTIAANIFFLQVPHTVAEDIKGKIVQSNDTTIVLSGASISWLGTNRGVKSDAIGNFFIQRKTPSDSQLIISYIGFKKDTVSVVDSERFYTFVLQQDAKLSNIIVEEIGGSTLSKAEIKTEKISSRQLRESACCSLAESFERSPAVEVSYSDAATGSKMIQLLGLKGMYTQQLQEAIPGMRGLAMPFGMDFVPGAFLESISISKGAASVMNGYEGISGQINIEYIKPLTSPPLFINAYVNQMQRYELNIASSFEPAKNWYGLIMAHGSLFDHEVDGNNDGFIDMPLFKKANLAFRIEHLGKNIEFQAFLKGIVDEYKGGISGMHVHDGADSNDAKPMFETRNTNQRIELFTKLGFLDLDYSFAQSIAFQCSAAFHDIESILGPKLYTGIEKTLFAKAIAMNEFDEYHKVFYGLSMLYDDYNETFLGDERRRTEYVPGIFFEDSYMPDDNITIVMGLRADYHSLYGMVYTPRIHAKYSPTEMIQLRASAGSGMRIANPIVDNLSAFVNNRKVFIDTLLNPEKAWNMGASVTTTVDVFSMPVTVDAELYHTVFSNQINVDYDNSAREVRIINDSMSYATSAMIQAQITPWERSTVTMAWRFNDVWMMTGHRMQRRVMLSPQRVLTTLSQSFLDDELRVDLTGIWNSGGRLPSTQENPESLRMEDNYPGFYRLNAQISWKTSDFDIYLGAENILNTLQNKVVIDGMRPASKYFDASLVWGILDNRMLYLGIRTQLN